MKNKIKKEGDLSGRGKNERMDAFQEEALTLANQCEKIEFRWIPRELNMTADHYSKQVCGSVDKTK